MVQRLNRHEEPVPAKAGIKRFEDIEAWQLARELTRKVYRLTKKPRFEKDYGLKRQIQEAAGSAMHNIAEGFDSETNPEFIRFLRYAKRSCTEVLWTRITFPQMNFKMSTNRRGARVLPFAVLSTTSRNIKRAWRR